MLGMDKIVGRVRGLIPGNYAENKEEEQLHLTPNGDGLTGQGLPELAELVRHGDSWQVMPLAFAALTAVPTTVAVARLWNGEPGNGKIYVIDSVAVFKPIIDVTTDDIFTVFAQIVRPPVAAFTDILTGQIITSLNGKYTYGGRARRDTNVAASAESGRWTAIGTGASKNGVIGGSAWACVDIPLRGQYIVPPGGAFCLNVAEITNTASAFRACIRWHEVQINSLS